MPHCSRVRALVLLLAFAVILQGGVIRASAQTGVFRSAQTEEKRIALTFDDGPHPTQTPRILEILSRYGITATFFMVGKNVTNYSEAAQLVIAGGHEVGNHTFSHAHVNNLDSTGLSKELGLCEDTLEELCEYRPHLFRPPEGAVNSEVRHCSDAGDYALILWSLDTRDWECKNADEIAARVLKQVQPGDIILMHDYIAGSKTPEALEILLPQLLGEGYEFVTVSQLLGLW